MHTAESDPDDGHQFELLACAIAGREVKIADLAPGEPAWTDGVRIHLDPSTDAEERLRTVATQASLIAAGSLEPELLRRIGRRNGLARRYLSIEGDRALRVNEVAGAFAGLAMGLNALATAILLPLLFRLLF